MPFHLCKKLIFNIMTNLQNSLERLRTLSIELPENQKNIILESIKDIPNETHLAASFHVFKHVEFQRELNADKIMTEEDEISLNRFEELALRFQKKEQFNFQEFIIDLEGEVERNEKERDFWKEKYLEIHAKSAGQAT
jgi:hypothetical protein